MTVMVQVTERTVDISFEGLDRLLTMRSGCRIPHHVIRTARVVPASLARSRIGWRRVGTYVPGLAAAGRFRVIGEPDQTELWCAYRDPELLEIETVWTRPCRVVLQHPDRHRLAWWIGERARADG